MEEWIGWWSRSKWWISIAKAFLVFQESDGGMASNRRTNAGYTHGYKEMDELYSSLWRKVGRNRKIEMTYDFLCTIRGILVHTYLWRIRNAIPKVDGTLAIRINKILYSYIYNHSLFFSLFPCNNYIMFLRRFKVLDPPHKAWQLWTPVKTPVPYVIPSPKRTSPSNRHQPPLKARNPPCRPHTRPSRVIYAYKHLHNERIRRRSR